MRKYLALLGCLVWLGGCQLNSEVVINEVAPSILPTNQPSPKSSPLFQTSPFPLRQRTTVTLAAQNGSTINGIAVLEGKGEITSIDITTSGRIDDKTVFGHYLYQGTCAQPQTLIKEITPGAGISSSDNLPIKLADLSAKQPLAILIKEGISKSQGNEKVVACGEIR